MKKGTTLIVLLVVALAFGGLATANNFFHFVQFGQPANGAQQTSSSTATETTTTNTTGTPPDEQTLELAKLFSDYKESNGGMDLRQLLPQVVGALTALTGEDRFVYLADGGDIKLLALFQRANGLGILDDNQVEILKEAVAKAFGTATPAETTENATAPTPADNQSALSGADLDQRIADKVVEFMSSTPGGEINRRLAIREEIIDAGVLRYKEDRNASVQYIVCQTLAEYDYDCKYADMADSEATWAQLKRAGFTDQQLTAEKLRVVNAFAKIGFSEDDIKVLEDITEGKAYVVRDKSGSGATVYYGNNQGQQFLDGLVQFAGGVLTVAATVVMVDAAAKGLEFNKLHQENLRHDEQRRGNQTQNEVGLYVTDGQCKSWGKHNGPAPINFDVVDGGPGWFTVELANKTGNQKLCAAVYNARYASSQGLDFVPCDPVVGAPSKFTCVVEDQYDYANILNASGWGKISCPATFQGEYYYPGRPLPGGHRVLCEWDYDRGKYKAGIQIAH